MILKSFIREELWLAISKTYEAGNYSHAIIDAIHYLSNVLRDKAGIDGDGVNLVGRALGGKSPKLRVNKLQTETERNVQKGLEQILRGLYLGIRNPRSHEQVDDKQEDADAIIIFINYLLSILEASEEPFTIPRFLSRVFDPDFVESERYAQLLLEEIPHNKRFDTLVEIYRERRRGNGRSIKYMVDALLQSLTNEQQDEFFSIVSDELKTERLDKATIVLLQMLSPASWYRIDEASRIRIENKIIKSIQGGEMDHFSRTGLLSGGFGTWGKKFFPSFVLRSELTRTFIEKLRSQNQHERRYVSRFYLDAFPQIFITETERQECIDALSWAIRQGGREFNENVANHLLAYPEDWRRDILTSLQDVTDVENPQYYLSDGTPFLGNLVEHDDIEYEDIPF